MSLGRLNADGMQSRTPCLHRLMFAVSALTQKVILAELMQDQNLVAVETFITIITTTVRWEHEVSNSGAFMGVGVG